MDFLGIGIPEAIFFILIMLIILGPADMAKVGRTLGTNLRKLWTSPTWRMIFSTSNTLRNLPNALAREAGVEELRKELQKETESLRKIGKEISDAAQVNIPSQAASPAAKSASTTPKESPQENTISDGEFSAWTTPVNSTPADAALTSEADNMILPPHLQNPQAPPNDEPAQSDSSPSTD